MLESVRLSAVIVLAALCVAPPAFAEEEVTHGTVNGNMGYQSTSSGDPLGSDGARVTVSAEGAPATAHGGIIYGTSAQRWTNKAIQLSAVVEATTPEAKPALWLRADGSSGKLLEFASSAGSRPSADGRLDVEMRVPADATRLVFGVVMQGPGRASADGLRLAQRDHPLPGNGASARQVYDAAVKVVVEHAYWSSRIDTRRRDAGTQLSSEPGTGYQARAAIRALLGELNDGHSFYMGPEEADRNSRSGATPDAADVRRLDGHVGYARIPSVRGTDPAMARAFATQVGQRLQEVNEGARCGWVVDLRKDHGGNMWPMISALGIFFGNERLGGFKGPDGSIRWWSTRSPKVTPVPAASAAQAARVAVLLGPGTASSGEAVAVAFIGRNNTRSFGAPSNGRASSNSGFGLPDGSMIYLMTAIDVDRAGREVGGKIVPDVSLPDDIVSSSEVPGEALRWLAASCGG